MLYPLVASLVPILSSIVLYLAIAITYTYRYI